MSDLSRPPTAMIVLASEQLWPNLHGLVHWQSGLRRLCIYHTDNERLSGRPARQLEGLCRRLYGPRIAVHRLPAAGGMRPADVRAQLEQWLHAFPNERWLVNASGGIKLMFNGACSVAGMENVDVVYRELADEWFVLARGDGCLDARPITIPAGATDAIDVKELVRAFWETETAKVQFAADPAPLDVAALTRAARESNWKWTRAFDRIGLPRDGLSQGKLFERYVAAVVLALGVRNVAVNVEHRSTDGTSLQEIDLVANHGGRLLILDVKLRSEEDEEQSEAEPITSQIRQAAHTQRDLGGLRARSLLVRPNRDIPGDIRDLAKASNLEVLGPEQAGDLFGAIGRFFGVQTLPAELQTATKELQGRPGQPPFSSKPRVVEALEAAGASLAVADLDAYREAHGAGEWVCYLLENKVHFHCRNLADQTDGQVTDGLRRLFQAVGTVAEPAWSKSRKTYWFDLQIRGGCRQSFQALLEERLGRPLLD